MYEWPLHQCNARHARGQRALKTVLDHFQVRVSLRLRFESAIDAPPL
jgi:hypothetical protein